MSMRSSAIGLATVVVLMGAGAAQSLTGSNTVFTDDIADAHVRVADIGTGAVGSSEIIDNSIRSADIGNNLITGDDVNESTLVPTCPAGMSLTRDICYGAGNAATTWASALSICVAAGLRLPSIVENILVALVAAPIDDGHFWTESVYTDDDVEYGTTSNAFGVQTPASITAGATRGFFCVTTVGARPAPNPSPSSLP